MHVLLLNPDSGDPIFLGEECAASGHEVTTATRFADARRLLGEGRFEVALARLGAAPDRESREGLVKVCDLHNTAIILLADESSEVAALCPIEQRVVADFAVKPFDVTNLAARIEALGRRREARNRERALLDAMPDMMFRLKADGTYVDYHVARGELLYVPPEQFLGRTVDEMLPAELAAQTKRNMAKALETGASSYEYELPLGSLGVHHFEARLVRSARDEVLAIVRDVTEQRRTVAALAHSEQTMRALLEAMPDTMFRWRQDGVLVDYIPRRGSPLAGQRDEVVGKRGEEILSIAPQFPRELAAEFRERLIRALDSGELQTVQYSLEQGGSRHHRESRLVPCGQGEVLGIDRDITELKRAEEELRAAARVKQAFASRVLEVQENERQHLARELHDVIGQRLLVHRMDAEWLIKRSGPAVANAAEKLCASLDETLVMIRSLAQGLRPPALDDLGIGSALETLIHEMSGRSGIDGECHIGPGVAHLSMPAALAIYRIAQEAMANALRHAGCRRVELTLTRSRSQIELRVADDGSGISPGRVDAPTSLGLIGMRERAELLGGRVTIEAAGGGGTVVVARIPRPSSTVEEAE